MKRTEVHSLLGLLRFFLQCARSSGDASVEGAGPPRQVRIPMLTLAGAFADKPGQEGSVFTPAAFMRALLSPT